MKLKTTALLITSLLVLAGCDQAEKSAQQLMGKAAESAKLAIDETHKAAEQALSHDQGNGNARVLEWHAAPGSLPLVVAAWLLVGIPLAWGIWVTLQKTAVLFN